MHIKEFEFIEDKTKNHSIYFIKKPNKNVIFEDDEDKQFFFSYLSKKSCSDLINKTYIQNTHKSKDIILILVINLSLTHNDFRMIQGFCYFKPILHSDFIEAYKPITNKPMIVDKDLEFVLNSFKTVLDEIDTKLKLNKIAPTDIYKYIYKPSEKKKIFNQLRKNNLSNTSLKILDRLQNQNNEVLLFECATKLWQLNKYCYICLICSNQQKGGIIIDTLSSLSLFNQKRLCGFVYQALSLNGVDTAYEYYLKKNFKRSIDGISYYSDNSLAMNVNFTGEYDGYLFTKRIDINSNPEISEIIQNIQN
jgi:hypothetical protein